MIPERMSLRNYKRFKDVDIDFADGITGIVGNNGTGKSSIVDAIFFALFGVSGGISSDFVVSSFAEGEKCEVTLDFIAGSDSFRLQRTFKKTKSIQHDATLLCNDTIRASGVSQVDTEIRRILGMGPADFRSTVYAAQKDLMTLLDMRPGERKKWFLRALGIDYLNTGSQEILKARVATKESDSNRLQGELAALSRQDPAELDQTRVDLANLQGRIAALVTEEADCNAERKIAFDRSQEYNLRVAQHGKLLDRHRTIQSDIDGLVSRVESLSQQITSVAVDDQEMQRLGNVIAEISSVREKFEGHRAKKVKLDQLSAEHKSALREETDLKSRLNKIKTQLEEMDRGEEELTDIFEKIRTSLGIDQDCQDVEKAASEYASGVSEKISILKSRIQTLGIDLKKVESNLEALRSTGPEGKCPICLQRLGDHYADVEKEYTARITEMRNEGATINQALDGAMKESLKVPSLSVEFGRIKQIRKVLGYRENLETECHTLRSKMDDVSHNIQGINISIAEIAYKEEEYLSCQKQLSDIEAVQKQYSNLLQRVALQSGMKAKVAEITSQIESKTVTLAEVKTAIDTDPTDLSMGSLLTREVERIDNLLKTVAQDLATSIERERTLSQKVKDLELSAVRIVTVQTQVAALLEEIEILKLTRAAISDYVVYLMQVVRARLETEVSTIIAEITGGRYDQVLIDEDFNLLVRENGKDYSVDRFSGGEQDNIAVALRIALSRYLEELHNVQGSTLLIFDEIFGSQDEERRNNLLTALRSQKSHFQKIFLISHIAEIQGEFENVLIVKSDGPTSSVISGQ